MFSYIKSNVIPNLRAIVISRAACLTSFKMDSDSCRLKSELIPLMQILEQQLLDPSFLRILSVWAETYTV